MSHPLNTPLGRFGIVTSEEGPQRCIASIPAGAMINPLTGHGDGREDRPMHTASLRVNFLRQFGSSF